MKKSNKKVFGFLTEVLYNVSLNLYSTGKNYYDVEWHWGPEIRDYYIFHYVIQGESSYTVNHKTYTVKAGDGLLIYPDTVSYLDVDGKEPYEYYWVNFNGAIVKDLVENTDYKRDNPVIHVEENLEPYLKKLYKENGLQPYQQTHMIGYLYLIFSAVLKSSSKKSKENDQKKLYVNKALDFISVNYSRDITVNDIANHINLSRSHMYRLFMEEMDLSPIQYLTQYRIEKSIKLLKETNLPIAMIAEYVGIKDAMYFSKLFTKHTGTSPTKYKRKNL